MSVFGGPPLGEFSEQFSAGMQAGLTRLERAAPELPVGSVSFEQLVATPELTDPLLAAAELVDNTPPRFATLVGELVTVASVSRLAYNEPPLQRYEIETFLEQLTGFINSFRHA